MGKGSGGVERTNERTLTGGESTGGVGVLGEVERGAGAGVGDGGEGEGEGERGAPKDAGLQCSTATGNKRKR